MTLADPKDILSLKTLTETTTLNGRTSTSVFDAATQPCILVVAVVNGHHRRLSELEPTLRA